MEYLLTTDVNQKNSEGETLFYTVIKKWETLGEADSDYYENILRALIARGADINEPNNDGKTPLVYAIEQRNLQIIEFLQQNKANFSVTTIDGKPLIHLVFSSIYLNIGNDADMSIFEFLLKHTPNAHEKNSEGDTPFHMLIWKWTCSAYTENSYYKKIARALINNGADVNEANMYGTKPLFHAIDRHNLCVAEFLGENGADFNAKTKCSDTLLHVLARNINYHLVTGCYETEIKLFELLLERSTNIYHLNVEGRTPFFYLIGQWATSKEEHTVFYMKVAQAMLAKYTDINEPDKWQCKILPFNAIEKHNLHIIEFLEENGADLSIRTLLGETLLHLLVRGKDCWKGADDKKETKLFKLLVSKGQVNARDKNGMTPLHVAAMHSNVHVVRMLIEHGARINCRNYYMATPLHFSTSNPKVEIVGGLLLKLGANPNAKDSRGRTPLHKIVMEPRTEHTCSGIQLLLQHGADINSRASGGFSALTYARFRDIFDLRQKRQAYINQENESRRLRAAANGDALQPRLMTIDECPIRDMASDAVMFLTKYSIKLKAANFPWDKLINSWLGHFYRVNATREICDRHYEVSVNEVKSLKSIALDSRTSLYDFLHMDQHRTRFYCYNEQLRKLIRSPLKLQKFTFPVYGDLILVKYREALIRKQLLEPSRMAWLKYTEVELPAVCVDIILSFLSNAELFFMLGKY